MALAGVVLEYLMHRRDYAEHKKQKDEFEKVLAIWDEARDFLGF